MSHRHASRRFKDIHDAYLAAEIAGICTELCFDQEAELRSSKYEREAEVWTAWREHRLAPRIALRRACRCSNMSLSLLNNLLQQYGPHALPYPEQAKWTVRDHLLELQKVCHMPYVVCLSSCDYQSQHIASRPVRRRSFLRSASARGSSSPGMGGGFDLSRAQLLAHPPSDLLGTQPCREAPTLPFPTACFPMHVSTTGA